MVDTQQIDEMIQDFEDGGLNLDNCNELASLYIIRAEFEKQGLMEETTIDESIDNLQSLLVKYMIDRDVISLNILLTQIGEILSELYHTCDKEEERIEFKEFISRVQSILTPTVC